jgi:hypothetical protein
MTPQIDWQVHDDHGQEEIARTQRQPRRWRVSLIALMIVLGASLGATYASIKEPALGPTPLLSISPLPTTSPTVTAPSYLSETVDREAQALADGDFKTFIALQDQTDPGWYQAQSKNFRAWGRPFGPHGTDFVYYRSSSEPPTSDLTWVDIAQYRDGEYFRETRFYRRVNGQWLHTVPDSSFWSGQYESTSTAHINVNYPIEDSDLISTVANRFEITYLQICHDLDCPIEPTGTQSILVLIQPNLTEAESSSEDQRITIRLPSPRVSGFYEADDQQVRQLDDPILNVARDYLILPLVLKVAGGSQNRSGGFYLFAFVGWEIDRVSAQRNMKAFLPPAQLSNNILLIKLESLWTQQDVPSNPEQVATSVIFFIELKYGVESVSKFLKAIGPADSFKQALQNSLGVNEIQFEQQWKEWLKQVYAQGS